MFSNEFVAGHDDARTGAASWATSGRTRPTPGTGAARAAARSTRCCCSTRATTAGLHGSRREQAARRRSRSRHRLGHLRPGRLRALRLPRRHLAADRRGALEDRAAGDDRQAPASSCSATRTSTACTPTGRCSLGDDPAARCPATRRAPAAPTSAATAATSSSASCARTCRGFWRFLDGVTRDADGTRDPPQRGGSPPRWSAAGRAARRSSLAPDGDDPEPRRGANDFGYHEHDRADALPGRRAHPPHQPARLARPQPGTARLVRDQPAPPDPAARPRVRDVADDRGGALAGGDDAERGLHFICLNANIQRQFEFIQHTWLNNPKFAGLYDDADPIAAPSIAAVRDLHDPDRRRSRARDRRAALRLGPGRRLLLPAGHRSASATWRGSAASRGTPRRPSARSARRRSSAGVAARARSTSVGARGSGSRAAGARRSCATGCTRAPARTSSCSGESNVCLGICSTATGTRGDSFVGQSTPLFSIGIRNGSVCTCTEQVEVDVLAPRASQPSRRAGSCPAGGAAAAARGSLASGAWRTSTASPVPRRAGTGRS